MSVIEEEDQVENEKRNSQPIDEVNKSKSSILANSLYCWQSASNTNQYIKNLENEYENLLQAFLDITSQFARLQFRVRQYIQAEPKERCVLLKDLERLANAETGFNTPSKTEEEFPPIERDNKSLGDIKSKQYKMIEIQRAKIANLDMVSANISTDYADDNFNVHIYHEHSVVLDGYQLKPIKCISEEDLNAEKDIYMDPNTATTSTTTVKRTSNPKILDKPAKP